MTWLQIAESIMNDMSLEQRKQEANFYNPLNDELAPIKDFALTKEEKYVVFGYDSKNLFQKEETMRLEAFIQTLGIKK